MTDLSTQAQNTDFIKTSVAFFKTLAPLRLLLEMNWEPRQHCHAPGCSWISCRVLSLAAPLWSAASEESMSARQSPTGTSAAAASALCHTSTTGAGCTAPSCHPQDVQTQYPKAIISKGEKAATGCTVPFGMWNNKWCKCKSGAHDGWPDCKPPSPCQFIHRCSSNTSKRAKRPPESSPAGSEREAWTTRGVPQAWTRCA